MVSIRELSLSVSVILTLALLLVAGQLPAQGPGGRGGGMSANGRVYGKVLDASTRKPAEFATVTVYRKDSLLGGGIVRTNGDFSVEKLPLGPLRVVISFIGYTPLEQQVTLSRERMELDMGNIALQPDEQLLNEVEIVGERNTMVMQVDRRVFNVDKDLTTQGGSGVDVMKNIPGLSVDVDGNVEMRGSNPQILIDGRPTTITLDQLPAEEIERVEVITNPSVAFDASTSGGIINVVLKKNTKPGYSGQVQAGAGSNDRYQGGLNLNMREGRLGLNLSYNFNTSTNVTDGRTLREDLLGDDIQATFEQNSSSRDRGTMQGGRFGIDYQVNNRNMISLSQNLRFRNREGGDEQRYSNEDLNGELITYGAQVNSNDMKNGSYTTQLAWRHQGPEGREWSADVNYNRWDRNSSSLFELFGYGGAIDGLQRAQENIGGSDLNQFGGQLDVIRPMGNNKLEWGLKGSYKLDHTWLYVSVLTPPATEALPDSALTNDYDITDIVNAAYVNWSRKLTDRWSIQAGLRFEQTWFVTELRGKDQTFSYKYPNGSDDLVKAFFPGLYLSRRWDSSMRELQINFSRKIERPRFWQIMPFIMFSDARNLRIGNPATAPEFSNIAEINHLLPFLKGKASWFTSLYGRFTEDVITGFSSPLKGDSTILLNTFVNGSFSTTAGWEHVLKVEPFAKFQVTLSGSLRYTNIALSSANGGTRNEGFNWETKLLMAYRFGSRSNWNAQVNGEYESPEIQPQGRTLSQYGIDASVGHDITRKLSAVVSVNDVFFTRRWGNILETPNFYQENFRRREMRFVRFTLTWKFGEQNTSLFRRRGEQQRREPGSGGGDIDM